MRVVLIPPAVRQCRVRRDLHRARQGEPRQIAITSCVNPFQSSWRCGHGRGNSAPLDLDPTFTPVSKQVQIGVVGYAYQQLTGDLGSGATLGSFKSRVFGIGPQIGFIFPVGEMGGYLNIKGYKEFDAENCPEGWNLWVTFALSPAEQPAPPPPRRPPLVWK